MQKGRKIALTVLCVGVLGSIAAFGVFGAFTSTTSNPGNQISSGTVEIADNDAGSSLYNVANAKPGDSVTRCIKVTYAGSLDADVHLYTGSSIGALGQYVDLKVTPGTQSSPSFPNCSGFVADSSGDLYSGTLADFGANRTGWASGVVDNPGSSNRWVTNDSVVYRVTATLQGNAPDAAQGLTTGVHNLTWEARNQ